MAGSGNDTKASLLDSSSPLHRKPRNLASQAVPPQYVCVASANEMRVISLSFQDIKTHVSTNDGIGYREWGLQLSTPPQRFLRCIPQMQGNQMLHTHLIAGQRRAYTYTATIMDVKMQADVPNLSLHFKTMHRSY